MTAMVSSHTLDGTDGTHAGGIAVRLVNLTTGAEIFVACTDAGGRLMQAVDLTGADPADRYDISFATGPYWRARGIAHDGLVDEVVLRFAMPDPAARYHMPLILSPNGYSCWASIPER
ncbi:MAG: hydroxyisourate hydrolase [Rhodobacteraceae bacterium]|nr:hydroxyisourate hydrolase [Paracoccaceae bacterium]